MNAMRFLQGLSPAAVASLVVASLAAAPLSAASAQVIVIQNAELHTMAGAGVIENGDVVIRDGEIAAVGEDLTPPAGATVIDAEGLVATPG
ncbi:MAG: imidazolonepropionase, partial [Pseudomonadota bacterium]